MNYRMYERDKRQEVVVHFSRSDRQFDRSWLDYLDIRLLGIVAVILAVTLVRTVRDGRGIFWTPLLFVGAGAIFLAYRRLRQSNVTLYTRANRLGITNSLGLVKDASVVDVAGLVMCSLVLPQRKQPLPVLVAVSKSGRCLFRLSGADRLPLDGINRVATAAGVQLTGNWTDTLSLAAFEARFPGAVPPVGELFAWVLANRGRVSIVIIIATVLVFVGLVLVETGGH
jgi:hypothetical protein